MDKRILVTGAAGFIGFHLSKALSERGDFVIGYDNFNDYYSQDLKRARESELPLNIIEGDLCDGELLNQVVEENGITHLVNLAAQAGVRYSIKNPQAYLKSNVEGFLNVLEVIRKHPKIKLTYASSSSVYGYNKKVPFSETDQTDNQASLYGSTKKTDELFATAYHNLYGISVTGLRFFTVYGPWGRPDMAYYSFAEAIMKGNTINVFNNGKLSRDFTYIDDVIKGTIAAIDLESEHEIFNLGNNQPVELMQFIKTLEKSLGKKANIHFEPMQQGDVYQTYADIQHSTNKLGYSPTVSLAEGIPKFIEWFFSFANKMQRK